MAKYSTTAWKNIDKKLEGNQNFDQSEKRQTPTS